MHLCKKKPTNYAQCIGLRKLDALSVSSLGLEIPSIVNGYLTFREKVGPPHLTARVSSRLEAPTWTTRRVDVPATEAVATVLVSTVRSATTVIHIDVHVIVRRPLQYAGRSAMGDSCAWCLL